MLALRVGVVQPQPAVWVTRPCLGEEREESKLRWQWANLPLGGDEDDTAGEVGGGLHERPLDQELLV